MEIMTFSEILTKLCDDFDELIMPRKIYRSNTNIIYLIFKAIAKGFEVINNICVVLSHKFDPANCSEEDLVSVASLVGTERRAGSATGLHIIATNKAFITKVLFAGEYKYVFDEETIFSFEVLTDTQIGAGESVSYIAMSDRIGQFPITTQTDIAVESERNIDSDISFSCTNNESLLGAEPESLLSFRQRILNTYDRQNSIVEMEEYLRNLPYLFDCKVRYNQTDYDIDVDGITIPPMSCAIFFSGEAKNDIAEKVADYIICPTVATENSVEVRYENPVFANGYYAINLIPFAKLNYKVKVIYSVENEYVNVVEVKEKLKKELLIRLTGEQHIDTVREEDIYAIIQEIDHSGLTVLAVNLVLDDSDVDFIEVPVDKIAELIDVEYEEG